MHLKLKRLYKNINHTFINQDYLQQALTHRSQGPKNNERLEFLGDALLSAAMAHILYLRFPNRTEGELSRLRAYLVRGDMLSQIAMELSLGDYLILGQGELKNGGFNRGSTLADALEALFAAIFLDTDFETVQRSILQVFQSKLDDPNLFDYITDPKTKLQERLQAQKHPLPTYVLVNTTGEEHHQTFEVSCEVARLNLKTTGCGETRRKAEQEAARQFLDQWAMLG